jgi:glycosyltransferase involved in cell wall biosynthesis
LIVPEIETPLRSGFSGILRKICEQNDVEIVHFHFFFSLPFSLALLPKSWKLPTVYHWHNPPVSLIDFLTPPNTFKGRLKRFISTLVARLTDLRVIDKHISMSKEISDLLLKNSWTSDTKISYIPNGVINSSYNERNISDRSFGNLIIGTVSNFRTQKDYETLIKAFNILCRDEINCELWLVGDGETRPEIEKLTSELGIKSRVRFIGTLPDPSEMYLQFDIFALSTHYEGHPLVILEAMSFGLPIVATNISSVPETISHNVNGLLVNHQDPTDLVEVLRKLIVDPELRNRLGQEAKRTVENKDTVQDWAKKIINVYEECLTEEKK